MFLAMKKGRQMPPLAFKILCMSEPRDMETVRALASAACEAEPLITAAADG